ncbi:cyclin-like protein [Metschnikowia bicuspidata var. bicuspidata NRRL YB-4993]|uniref:Cyclin-like protein n=1 Tax=Metschnikowia bicuspidata var. bicuspidata NRRL YB-4993 TaxID=869754 RepID=A0A1A0HDF1_9ASCO|nr:cyclin-like protein [Metschnikowia bicuspidata var. bicuspidata NRRL YB-4993]OBA22109.1 cyclin-like protein [Metschnikowia bicuspidata var. bicuspidata NRRL YB-4993]
MTQTLMSPPEYRHQDSVPLIHDTYRGENVTVNQYKYLAALYESELRTHALVVDEYMDDVTEAMQEALERTKPLAQFLTHQPYLTPSIRFKLLDFGLKLLVRLKVLPFVFCRAVRLFDRYCLKAIVLLPHGQLLMATCLWIAAKIHGGNCHFANMHSERPPAEIRSVLDLGYGAGARFNGPTQRYRLPRVTELIRLCGSRCNYNSKMFHQMEIAIMLNTNYDAANASRPCDYEFRRIKQFVAYAACFLYETVGYSPTQVAKTTIDLINQTFMLLRRDPRFQVPNQCVDVNDCNPDYFASSMLRKLLVSAVAKSPAFLLDLFADKGPQQLFSLIVSPSSIPALDIPKQPPLLTQTYSMPPLVSSPSSAQFGNSPVTPREYKYERVEIARSVKRLAERPRVVASQGEVGSRPCRRNTPVLLTPTPNPANLHSHHYPSILPHSSTNYAMSNAYPSSGRSSKSPKESEIFDQERPKLGAATPASSENEYKDRGFADVPAPMFKRFF